MMGIIGASGSQEINNHSAFCVAVVNHLCDQDFLPRDFTARNARTVVLVASRYVFRSEVFAFETWWQFVEESNTRPQLSECAVTHAGLRIQKSYS